MKLKYYLRGMGIGIILTAIVMGFALGGRKTAISDAEVIERAKALGMIDPNSGVLLQNSNGEEENDENEAASDSSLDQEGKEISEEVDEDISASGESLSDMAEKEEKTEDQSGESSESSSEVKNNSKASSEKTEDVTASSVASTSKTETTTGSSSSTEDTSIVETVTASSKNNSSDSSSLVNDDDSNNDSSSTASTQVLGSRTSVSKTVTIPGGFSSDQVAAILYNEGIIDSASSFNQYLIDRNMDRIIRSGTKTIPAGSTYNEIAEIICK